MTHSIKVKPNYVCHNKLCNNLIINKRKKGKKKIFFLIFYNLNCTKYISKSFFLNYTFGGSSLKNPLFGVWLLFVGNHPRRIVWSTEEIWLPIYIPINLVMLSEIEIQSFSYYIYPKFESKKWILINQTIQHQKSYLRQPLHLEFVYQGQISSRIWMSSLCHYFWVVTKSCQ